MQNMDDTSDQSSNDSQYPLRGSAFRYDEPFGSAFPIEPEIVKIDAASILDWESLHKVSAIVFGFPDFYGNNLNAWIDCMSDLRTESHMSKFLLQSRQMLQFELSNSRLLRTDAGDVYDGFIDGIRFVNHRFIADGEIPVISIVFV